VLPLPAPLARAVFAAPPVADVNANLTGQNYFIVIVGSNSIQLVAGVFFYCL